MEMELVFKQKMLQDTKKVLSSIMLRLQSIYIDNFQNVISNSFTDFPGCQNKYCGNIMEYAKTAHLLLYCMKISRFRGHKLKTAKLKCCEKWLFRSTAKLKCREKCIFRQPQNQNAAKIFFGNREIEMHNQFWF